MKAKCVIIAKNQVNLAPVETHRLWGEIPQHADENLLLSNSISKTK